jgi:hypothetical protein
VARVLSTAFLVLLLVATVGAFAATQGAKLEKSPIFRTRIPVKVFSPDCECATGDAQIEFSLRKADTVRVWMERNGVRVATVVAGQRYPAGPVTLSFSGLTESGLSLPDGVYVPVVHLSRAHKTIRLPNEIRIDTKAPTIVVKHPQHAIISPDGDGRKDTFRTRYVLGEAAHAILYVNHRRVFYTLRKPLSGQLVWNGKVGKPARPARPGVYLLEASARDAAGNRAKPFPFAIVQVRYVALARKRVIARPGRRFAIRVSTDAPTVRWLLHGRSGIARRGTMKLRAPKRKGVYKLYVTAAGHAAKASVVVA